MHQVPHGCAIDVDSRQDDAGTAKRETRAEVAPGPAADGHGEHRQKHSSRIQGLEPRAQVAETRNHQQVHETESHKQERVLHLRSDLQKRFAGQAHPGAEEPQRPLLQGRLAIPLDCAGHEDPHAWLPSLLVGELVAHHVSSHAVAKVVQQDPLCIEAAAAAGTAMEAIVRRERQWRREPLPRAASHVRALGNADEEVLVVEIEAAQDRVVGLDSPAGLPLEVGPGKDRSRCRVHATQQQLNVAAQLAHTRPGLF